MERYPVPPSRPWLNSVPEVAQHRRGTVAVGEDPAQVVGTGQHESLRRERLGGVAEQRVGVVAQQGMEIEGSWRQS